MEASLFYVIARRTDINAATGDSEPAPFDDDRVEIPPRRQLRYNDSKTIRLLDPTASLLSCLIPDAMSW